MVAGGFFSGTGFLGGTVTKDIRIYVLESVKMNDKQDKFSQCPEFSGQEGWSIGQGNRKPGQVPFGGVAGSGSSTTSGGSSSRTVSSGSSYTLKTQTHFNARID